MALTITDAEQTQWQLRAHTVLGTLLRKPGLPVLAWSIASAGCVVTGEVVSGVDSARRAAFDAWAADLGLDVRPERVSNDMTHLTARGRRDNVQVLIRATLYGDPTDE